MTFQRISNRLFHQNPTDALKSLQHFETVASKLETIVPPRDNGRDGYRKGWTPTHEAEKLFSRGADDLLHGGQVLEKLIPADERGGGSGFLSFLTGDYAHYNPSSRSSAATELETAGKVWFRKSPDWAQHPYPDADEKGAPPLYASFGGANGLTTAIGAGRQAAQDGIKYLQEFMKPQA